jgi:signal transduction histidine kinase
MTTQTAVPTRAPHRRSIWGLAWRMTVAAVVGLVLIIFTVYQFTELEPRYPEYAGPFALYVFFDFVLGVAALCLLPFRRRAPLTIALISAALSAVTTFGFGAISIVLVSLATRRRPREIALAATVTVLAAIASTFILPDPEHTTELWHNALFGLGYLGICVVIGLYIGGRRELYVSLQDRARLAETEQAARLDAAQSAERTRIAREMHDVLAHRLSLVAMHSGALAYRDDLTREETAITAAVVRDNAHLALTELREVLGVLRDDTGGDTARAPQPTLAALPELLEQNSAAGTTVHCRIAPAVADALHTLPDSTGRNAFRIIQESLTNARRHAPGADVVLEIEGTPGEHLTIRLSNPLSGSATVSNVAATAPATGAADATESAIGAAATTGPTPYVGSGLGLPGLVERARLAGGHLRHGVLGDRFAVDAWLPWTAS